jgi:hypothetical protein
MTKKEMIEMHKKQFKDHVAQYWKLQGGPANGQVEMVRFQKPGTTNFFIEFLFTNGTLFVRGDLGEAAYCWHWDIGGIRQLRGVDIGYMKGKCQASEVGKEFNDWSRDELEKGVREYLGHREHLDGIKEMLAENDETIDDDDDEAWEAAKQRFIEQKIEGLLSEVGDHHEWINFCRSEGEEFFDDVDHWEYSYDLGNVTSSRMIAHHTGLIMALAKLEEKKVFDEVTV